MFLPDQLHRIAVVGVGCCGHNAVLKKSAHKNTQYGYMY